MTSVFVSRPCFSRRLHSGKQKVRKAFLNQCNNVHNILLEKIPYISSKDLLLNALPSTESTGSVLAGKVPVD
jgi:hypothetical protein